MRTIFLDFDGVLNSEHYYLREGPRRELYPSYGLHCCDLYDRALLDDIISYTGAEVVLSFTLRGHFDVPYLAWGFVGRTPSDCVLGNEIRSWLREHEDLLGGLYANR